jgi:hypothetical protein
VGAGRIVLGEEFADLGGCDSGSLRRRFGGFDNDREVEDFFALRLYVRSVYKW